jgi:hypothetical protein
VGVLGLLAQFVEARRPAAVELVLREMFPVVVVGDSLSTERNRA